MKRFYSTLGIDNAIKEQERDNIKANNMLNSTKTWQEEFDEKFVDRDGDVSCYQYSPGRDIDGLPDYYVKGEDVKQFITDLIDQTREETIKEILSQLRLKLRNTCKAEDIADTAFLTESDLESVLDI